jgi:hypothetical protein
MVRFTVGDGEGGNYEPLPAMRDVDLLCKDIEYLEANETYPSPRLKFIYEVEGGDDVADEFIGEQHFVYANLPRSKSGKLSPRSTLYALLEGMAGADFDPDDEVDTDDYIGWRGKGDFKKVPAKTNIGTQAKPNFVTKKDEDGNVVKKTELVNLRPRRTAKPKRRQQAEEQEEFDWEDDED